LYSLIVFSFSSLSRVFFFGLADLESKDRIQERHEEVGEEHEQVFGITNIQGEDRRDKEVVPDKGAEYGGYQYGQDIEEHSHYGNREEQGQCGYAIVELGFKVIADSGHE
jgi:hypothetical protein